MEVDGITVAKALEIENASVVSGSVSPSTGHLILQTAGGTEIDAGDVTPDVSLLVQNASANPSHQLILHRQGGTTVNTGIKVNYSPLDSYPVGSIYMAVVATSPAVLFGGTWEAWGEGRVAVGVDATQPEFDTVEEEGGVKEVTLTAAQSGSPAHTHTGLNVGGVTVSWQADAGGAAGAAIRSGAGGAAVSANASVAADAAAPHTNLQPYITCYMWKRVA